MNRIEILILDRRNGIICQEYIDAQSVLAFLNRSGHIHRFQVLVRKGEKAIYIEKIDVTNFVTKINDFQNQQ
jgi:hypothetical protein